MYDNITRRDVARVWRRREEIAYCVDGGERCPSNLLTLRCSVLGALSQSTRYAVSSEMAGVGDG